MGGTILTFEGKTPREVLEKLESALVQAENMGLYEEDRVEPEYDEKRKLWRAGVAFHT